MDEEHNTIIESNINKKAYLYFEAYRLHQEKLQKEKHGRILIHSKRFYGLQGQEWDQEILSFPQSKSAFFSSNPARNLAKNASLKMFIIFSSPCCIAPTI
jgi:hypothetical protein